MAASRYLTWQSYQHYHKLSSSLNMDIALIESTDLTKNDDDRWGYHVDVLLEFVLSERPEEVINELDWREFGCAAAVWRLQVQHNVLVALNVLDAGGLVNKIGYWGPIDVSLRDPMVDSIQHALLSCFEFVQKLLNPPAMALCEEHTWPFAWLAGMIVRGNCVLRLEPIFLLLESVGIFGRFDYEHFHRHRWNQVALTWQPMSMHPSTVQSPQRNRFDFAGALTMDMVAMEADAYLRRFEVQIRAAWFIFFKYCKFVRVVTSPRPVQVG